MNCDRIREQLTQYLLGDLDEATMEEVRAHLETCDGCRAEARKVEPTLDLLRDALAAASTSPERLTASRRARIFGEFTPGAKRVLLWVTQARPGLVAAAAVLVIGFMLAGTMMPAMSRSRESARRTASMSKLSQVGKAVQMYAMDHEGRLPDELDELGDYVDVESLEESPASGERYDYVGGGLSVDAPASRPVAIDRVDNGANVLHVDGSVTWYSGNEMREKGLVAPEESRVRLGLDLHDTVDTEAGDEAAANYLRPVGGGGAARTAPGTPAPRKLRRRRVTLKADPEAMEAPEPVRVRYEVPAPPPARQPASAAAKPSSGVSSDAVPEGKYFLGTELDVTEPDVTTEGLEVDEKKGRDAGGMVNGLSLGWSISGSGSATGPEMERQNLQVGQESERGKVEDSFSPRPAEFDAVRLVKSPVIMRGIRASRSQVESQEEFTKGGRFTTDDDLVNVRDQAETIIRTRNQVRADTGGKERAKPAGEAGRRSGQEIYKSMEAVDLDGAATVDHFSYREGEKADKNEWGDRSVRLFSNLEASKDQAGVHDNNGVVNGEERAGTIVFSVPDLDDSKIVAESAPADTRAFGDGSAAADEPFSPDPSDPSDLSDDFELIEEEPQVRYVADASAASGKLGSGEDELTATEILQRDMAPLLGDIPVAGRLMVAKGKKKAEVEERRLRERKEREEEPAEPRFKAFGANPFFAAKEWPFSTFSIDVDTASYTLARNYMLDGFRPPAEAVRTEEFVNFFDYAYKPPLRDTFKVYTQCSPSKFGHGLQLLKIGVKGRRLGREEQRQAVLTFLVDTSGSMNQPDRIGLVKKSLHLLVERLSPGDLVAIVQYDSHARLVLEHTPASQREAIDKVIDALQCGGSTNLEEGMHRAYEIAGRNFVGGGENRVLVLSDGVANLGTGAAEDILAKVEQYRNQGIYCSVFGFGMGTYDDEMLESLANKGDGAYNFIDSGDEAKRVFVDELAATLNTIAADVKIQVEFNPDLVKRYRQMGYENRQLKKEDFRNDAVDAGEVGSGQSVTALYELELGGRNERPTSNVQRPTSKRTHGTIAVVRVRYRRTDTGKVEEIEHAVTTAQVVGRFDEAPPRFRLAACAAEFAEILRGSPFAAGAEFEDVAAALRPVALDLHLDGRVQELQQMVQGAHGLSRAE